MLVYPSRQGNDLHVTLINYIPARTALVIDLIERALSFGDQRPTFAREVVQVEVWNGPSLERASDGSFPLPASDRGRILRRVPGFFTAG